LWTTALMGPSVLMCDKLTKYLTYILECVLVEQVADDTSVRMDRLRS
jgi:hypothetical protein